MPGRSRIRGSYVTRNSDGTFKKWTKVGASARADRRRKVGAKRIPRGPRGGLKRGYGRLGDYPPRVKVAKPLQAVEPVKVKIKKVKKNF